jgi:hypothetical protein
VEEYARTRTAIHAAVVLAGVDVVEGELATPYLISAFPQIAVPSNKMGHDIPRRPTAEVAVDFTQGRPRSWAYSTTS